jgi:hypothetical protein
MMECECNQHMSIKKFISGKLLDDFTAHKALKSEKSAI